MDKIFPAIPLVVTLMILGLLSSFEASIASVRDELGSNLTGPTPYGTWLARDGRAKVELSKCDNGLCNRISWLKQAHDDTGQPLRDSRNQDPLKRHRKILGLAILSEMAVQPDGSWKGRIYDPEKGRKFTAYLKVLNKYHLELKGCLGDTRLCRTFIWQRVQ